MNYAEDSNPFPKGAIWIFVSSDFQVFLDSLDHAEWWFCKAIARFTDQAVRARGIG